MRNQSGFTVHELLITMGIIAILAAIAIPNYFAWLPKQRLKNAAADLRSNMQHARLRAVKENESCTVSFNTAADTYTVACLGKTINLAQDYDPTVTFGAVDATGQIVFTSRGMTTDNGIFDVAIENDVDEFSIRVAPTGAIVSQRL